MPQHEKIQKKEASLLKSIATAVDRLLKLETKESKLSKKIDAAGGLGMFKRAVRGEKVE